MMDRYKTARAFRTALEDRLKRISHEQSTDLLRLRREVAFERMLARLFTTEDPPWLLKGGYVFELRLRAGARATKDLDLAVPAPSRLDATDLEPQKQITAVWKHLQAAAGHDLNDWFVFRIEEPIRDLEGPPYGGARFPDDEAVIRAVHTTCATRQTHAPPRILPVPPASWRAPYAKLAQECGLRLLDMEAGHAFVSEYWRTLDLPMSVNSTK
jgi:hypothetical protein